MTRLVLLLVAIVVSLAVVVPTLDDGSTGGLGVLVLPLLVLVVYLLLRFVVAIIDGARSDGG